MSYIKRNIIKYNRSLDDFGTKEKEKSLSKKELKSERYLWQKDEADN